MRGRLLVWLVAPLLALVLAYGAFLGGLALLGGIWDDHVIEARSMAGGGAPRWTSVTKWYYNEGFTASWKPVWPDTVAWGNRMVRGLARPGLELISWVTTHAVSADNPEAVELAKAIALLPPGITYDRMEGRNGAIPGSLQVVLEKDGRPTDLFYSAEEGLHAALW